MRWVLSSSEVIRKQFHFDTNKRVTPRTQLSREEQQKTFAFFEIGKVQKNKNVKNWHLPKIPFNKIKMALLKKVVKKIKMALFKEVSRREMEKEDGETKYFMKKENTFQEKQPLPEIEEAQLMKSFRNHFLSIEFALCMLLCLFCQLFR